MNKFHNLFNIENKNMSEIKADAAASREEILSKLEEMSEQAKNSEINNPVLINAIELAKKIANKLEGNQ